MATPWIPYQEIANHLDIRKGDICLLASDITKLAFLSARKEGGFDANLFLDSIMKKLGTEGTLLIPAYNHHLLDGQSFDVLKTRPITGSLSIVAFLNKKFKRTFHPLHSFMVWGKYQDELCNLKNEISFGKDSPFAFLHQHNAKMILISTNIAQAFTFTHYVEEIEKVKYRKYKKIKINYTDENGVTALIPFKLFAKKTGWDMNLDKLELKLKEHELSESEINGISIQWISLSKAFNIVQNDIREKIFLDGFAGSGNIGIEAL